MSRAFGRWLTYVTAGVSLGMGSHPAVSQALARASADSALPLVVFRASAPHSTTPSYTFEVHPDGSGSYEAGAAQASEGLQPTKVSLSLSAKTTGRIFEEVQAIRHLGFACGAKMKGVADMGTKWLEYRGADGAGNCTYNYTQNRAASDLADVFGGIALTLSEGQKLAHLHQYDRLGLGDEMEMLVREVQSGQATEPGTIAPVLQSLVNDGEVLERVRVRAASLLKMAGAVN